MVERAYEHLVKENLVRAVRRLPTFPTPQAASEEASSKLTEVA